MLRTMTAFISIGVLGASLALFWRVHALSSRELDLLGPQFDALTAAWDKDGSPRAGRLATLLLSDADSGPDPFVPRAGEDDFIDAARAWSKRSLIGGAWTTQVPTPFARAVADSTTLVWCHDGFTAVSEKAMTLTVLRLAVKARDAGVEINIIAQGRSAAPVLKALQAAQAFARDGKAPGANKVILVGTDRSALKSSRALAAYDFARPANIRELANIWIPRNGVRTLRLQLSSAGQESAEIVVGEFWPGMAGESVPMEKLFEFLKESTGAREPLGAALARRETARRDAGAARTPSRAAAPRATASPQGDSLGMVKGDIDGPATAAFSDAYGHKKYVYVGATKVLHAGLEATIEACSAEFDNSSPCNPFLDCDGNVGQGYRSVCGKGHHSFSEEFKSIDGWTKVTIDQAYEGRCDYEGPDKKKTEDSRLSCDTQLPVFCCRYMRNGIAQAPGRGGYPISTP